MDAFRIGVLSGPARLVPAMSHQIANETAGGLELLPHPGRGRIDQMVAEQIAVGPVFFLPHQSQAFQTLFQRGVFVHYRGRRFFRHGCNLDLAGEWYEISPKNSP